MEAQKKQPKTFFKCCLPQCAGLRFNLVHRFPRKIERTKMWLQAFDNPRLNAIPHVRLTHINVCCRHFRVEDYVHSMARALNYVAVPSLNLKKLDELNQCRQTEIEEATVLTPDETMAKEWLKNQDIQQELLSQAIQETQNHDIHEKPQIVSNVVINSSVKTCSAPEAKTLSTITTPKAQAETTENIVSSSYDVEADQYIEEDSEKDFQLVVNEGFLSIVDSKWDTSIRLDILWLRSICRCSICYNDVECVPNTTFINLSPRLYAIMATVTEESRKLEIIWSDGHTSTYNLNDLYEKFLSTSTTKSNNYLLWSSQHHLYRDDLKPLKFYDIISNQTAIYTALDRLQKSGVLVIQDIPKCDKDFLVKKSIISKVFNHLWDNLITEKILNFQHYQTTPFTNCTFESMDKGLQIITLPYYKENLKLELCLVDGFQAVTQLSKITSDFLAKTCMDFGFTSKQGFKYIVKHPVITKADNCMERIMYSPYHLENLKSQDFKIWSMHLKQFNDILNLKHNQWNVELTSETMIILDNFRICWCLNEPPKEAELDCFYMERKHYLSSLNILKDSI